MARLKPHNECVRIHEQIYSVREQVLQKWQIVMSNIMTNDPTTCARYTEEMRDAIELWIASASAIVRASQWMICEQRFQDSLKPLLPEEIDKLRMNWWSDELSRPYGPIPMSIIENYQEPGPTRKYEDVNFLYRHSVAVHTKMFNINKLHPGNWHPSFQQRVMTHIMFFDSVIRYTGWALGRNSNEHAFYAFDEQVVAKIHRALDGVGVFDMDVMGQSDGSKIISRDHKRTDFGN